MEVGKEKDCAGPTCWAKTCPFVLWITLPPYQIYESRAAMHIMPQTCMLLVPYDIAMTLLLVAEPTRTHSRLDRPQKCCESCCPPSLGGAQSSQGFLVAYAGAEAITKCGSAVVRSAIQSPSCRASSASLPSVGFISSQSRDMLLFLSNFGSPAS